MDINKRESLANLKEQVRDLEEEIAREERETRNGQWQPTGFYAAYYAASGFMLGNLGAVGSLLFIVIASLFVGKPPLELIRVYLTFPFGEQALQLLDSPVGKIYAVSDNLVMALGCCLYLGTGMLLGIPVFVALAKLAPDGPVIRRIVVGCVVALLIWLVNFYGVLSWLQPVLFGGNWILDQTILPWWVAAAQHLVFGAIVALLYPLGKFVPYRRPQYQGQQESSK